VEAAIITDAIATPYRALTSKIRIQPGETLAVIGVGGWASMPYRLQGPLEPGLLPSISMRRHDRGKRNGSGRDAPHGKDDPRERILEAFRRQGIDAVADFVGKPETQMLGLAVLKVTGRFVAIGYNPVDPSHVNSQILVSRELEIYGSRRAGGAISKRRSI